MRGTILKEQRLLPTNLALQIKLAMLLLNAEMFPNWTNSVPLIGEGTNSVTGVALRLQLTHLTLTLRLVCVLLGSISAAPANSILIVRSVQVTTRGLALVQSLGWAVRTLYHCSRVLLLVTWLQVLLLLMELEVKCTTNNKVCLQVILSST